ncbi:D-cysteine desulfhydrase family protein [Chloroflexota bacterium]
MRSIPRTKFAHLPTAVEELPRITKLFSGPRLLVKRDDQTGLAFGGNKTRKLEFLIADAFEQNAGTLITAGAAQSNHCRQTAAAAAKFGFKCILILTTDDQDKDLISTGKVYSANLLLDTLFGAEIIWVKKEERNSKLLMIFKQAQDAGERPYLIPYGGSNPTGAVGYVFAIRELLSQFDSGKISYELPDWIVFPSSSGGTQAGMVLGARLFGYEGNILGISIDEYSDVLRTRVAKISSETANFLGEEMEFDPGEILVNDDYLGGGYGVVGNPELEAIKIFAQQEGLLLDPVYTARTAAGMIDLLRCGFWTDAGHPQTVLFWHTGGSTALFANSYSGLIACI